MHAKKQARVEKTRVTTPSLTRRYFRKFALKIGRQAVDHFRAPTFPFLIGENLASDFPVVRDRLGIRGQRRLELRSAYTIFDTLDKSAI